MPSKVQITRPNLTEYQNKVLYNDARITITEAAPKVGKTYSHLWWIFEDAHDFRKKGQEHWWVAPVYNQTQIAFNRLVRVVEGLDGYHINYSKLFILTPKQTVIRFKTADKPDNLYGEDVFSCVFDEFTRAKKQAWHALRSTLAATNGKIKMIGNYVGMDSWGHQLALQAGQDKEKEHYQINVYDALDEGILTEKEINQLRKDLPTSVFKKLYLLEEVDTADQLVEKDKLQDLFTNEVEEGRKYMTADIAMQGSDRFVIMIWKGFVLVEVYVYDKAEAKDIEKTIKGLASDWSIPRSNICYDADGLGAYLGSYLKNAKGFNNNGKPKKIKGKKLEFKNLKSQCYFNMAERINEGGYKIEADLDTHKSDLLEELRAVRNRNYGEEKKLEVMRKDEIREVIGRSPDLSDCFMQREYFELAGTGRRAVATG